MIFLWFLYNKSIWFTKLKIENKFIKILFQKISCDKGMLSIRLEIFAYLIVYNYK